MLCYYLNSPHFQVCIHLFQVGSNSKAKLLGFVAGFFCRLGFFTDQLPCSQQSKAVFNSCNVAWVFSKWLMLGGSCSVCLHVYQNTSNSATTSIQYTYNPWTCLIHSSQPDPDSPAPQNTHRLIDPARVMSWCSSANYSTAGSVSIVYSQSSPSLSLSSRSRTWTGRGQCSVQFSSKVLKVNNSFIVHRCLSAAQQQQQLTRTLNSATSSQCSQPASQPALLITY